MSLAVENRMLVEEKILLNLQLAWLGFALVPWHVHVMNIPLLITDKDL